MHLILKENTCLKISHGTKALAIRKNQYLSSSPRGLYLLGLPPLRPHSFAIWSFLESAGSRPRILCIISLLSLEKQRNNNTSDGGGDDDDDTINNNKLESHANI